MRTRNEIADDILNGLTGCPDAEITDHEKIAEAVRDGMSLDDLLEMDELNHWPETYVWFKNELCDESEEV